MIVFVRFENLVRDEDGRSWRAQVCGRQAADNMWEGWIEFEPQDGGEVIRTPRETTQPNRTDLEYWASGLTAAYLEGALGRALDPELPHLGPEYVAAEPAFTGPARAGVKTRSATRSGHAVLNPLEVYSQGEGLLREELNALGSDHLRTIIRDYDLASDDDPDPNALERPSLVELIVSAVRARSA